MISYLLLNLDFNFVYFITISRNATLIRATKELHDCMLTSIVKVVS